MHLNTYFQLRPWRLLGLTFRHRRHYQKMIQAKGMHLLENRKITKAVCKQPPNQ